MGLQDIIDNALKTIVSGPIGKLRVSVTYWPTTGRDKFGAWTYGSSSIRKVLVEDVEQDSPSPQGTVVKTVTKLTFLEPLAVAEGDKVKLPAALKKPARTMLVVRTVGGLLHPSGRPYMVEAIVGDAG